MSKDGYLVILTDATPDLKTSTTHEIIDLLEEYKKKKIPTIVMTALPIEDTTYKDATEHLYVWTPFYKSNNNYLRFISENWLGLALGFNFLRKFGFKVKIRGVIWISPSIFNCWTALFLKIVFSAKIYLVLRDLFPFWMSNVGIMRERSIVFQLLKIVARFQMYIADRIGVESSGTVNFFEVSYPNYLSKVEILSNWMSIKPRFHLENRKSRIKFVYAGNLGKAQGSDMLLALCERFRNDCNVEIHFIGRGEESPKLVAYKKNNVANNLFIYKELPPHEIDSFIIKNSIGLVFLHVDINTSNIPGKFMSYVMNGLPVLASVNPGNDLVKILSQYNMGRVSTSPHQKDFIEIAEEMVIDFKNAKFDTNEIINHAKIFFSTQKVVEQLENFINNDRTVNE